MVWFFGVVTMSQGPPGPLLGGSVFPIARLKLSFTGVVVTIRGVWKSIQHKNMMSCLIRQAGRTGAPSPERTSHQG